MRRLRATESRLDIIHAMLRILAALIVLVCTAACTSTGPPVKEVKLPSGKLVKVLAVSRVYFSNDSPALILRYQTDLKITDSLALRKEVDEIWESFRADVERANLQNAMVSAQDKPQGWLIKKASQYNSVFKKQQDGSWRQNGR